MSLNPRVASLLGLARRAGKLAAGDESCMKAIRSGQAALVVIAEDASSATIKRYEDKCSYYKVEWFKAGSRHELGQSIGRAEQVVIAVSDRGFADSLKAVLDKTEVQSIE